MVNNRPGEISPCLLKMPDMDTPVSLMLEVEETRLIESVTGGEMFSALVSRDAPRSQASDGHLLGLL
jgi:hypothetical protein